MGKKSARSASKSATKATSDTREKPLRIRLTDAERAMLDDIAADKGLPTATWARMELLRLAKEN
jgi:hypothetical protein